MFISTTCENFQKSQVIFDIARDSYMELKLVSIIYNWKSHVILHTSFQLHCHFVNPYIFETNVTNENTSHPRNETLSNVSLSASMAG